MTASNIKLVDVPSDSKILERDIGKMPVLECRHLGIEFGGLRALDDFSISMGPSEISGLIGPNGAGKTTAFNLLTKVYEPTDGVIMINGKDTHGKSTAEISHMGVARTFQNIRLFNNMTVAENVMVAMDYSLKCDLLSSVLRLPKYWSEEKSARKKALELLSIFNMQDEADYLASALPYGEQRRLEIVRALATNPKIILLDEPAAGMNPSETADLLDNIKRIRDDFGVAFLLIEHDMNLVMNVCEGICVLNFGKIIAKGSPEEIQNNPRVIEAYLGKSKEEE